MRLQGFAIFLSGLAGCSLLTDLGGLADGPDAPVADASADAGHAADRDDASAETSDDGGSSSDALPGDVGPADPCATYDAHMDDPVPDASLATCGSQTNILILQDSHNCGRCGHDCEGQTCIGGYCTPVVVATDNPPKTLAGIDDAFLYWIAGEKTVQRFPKDAGGDAETLSSFDDAGDDRRIAQFLVEPNVGYIRTQAAVTKVVFDAGTVTDISLVPGFGGLGHAGGRVFFSEWGGAVYSVDDDGGNSTPFLPQQQGGVEYASTRDGGVLFIGVMEQQAADAGVPGALLRVRPDGTDLQQVQTIPAPRSLTTDDKYVYWVDDTNNTLNRVPLDAPPDTPPIVMAQHPTGAIGSVVTDATHVYYFATEGSSGGASSTLFRVSKCGGPVAKLEEPVHADRTIGIELDEHYVYFGQWLGIVNRIPK